MNTATLDSDLQRDKEETLAAINRIDLIRNIYPQLKTMTGVRRIHTSYVGRGTIHYAAGQDQQHLPALLTVFGEDDWTLHQIDGQHYLQKVLPLGVQVMIEHVDPFSDALPDCHRVPQVEHSLS